MRHLDEYLSEAEVAHGHLCAGQVLGVRLAMLGLAKLGIDDPRGKDRKRLVTFVEIDRCATDAVGVVTGCRLAATARESGISSQFERSDHSYVQRVVPSLHRNVFQESASQWAGSHEWFRMAPKFQEYPLNPR